jgi:hypothetical protein
VLHQGTYTENITIGATDLNLDIVGANRSGATINGTVAFTGASSSVRVSGVQFLGNITHSGAGGVYLDECTIASGISFTKSGNGYTQFFDVEANQSAISVTGAGLFNMESSRVGTVTVNNANAYVFTLDCYAVILVTVTAGNYTADNSNIFSLTETSNSVISSPGTSVTLRNSWMLTPNGAQARVTLGGNYQIADAIFDRANSLLEGTMTGLDSKFSSLSLLNTTSSLTILGPITTPTGVGAAGQVLTSNGPGAPLTWSAGGGGGAGTVTSVTAGTNVTVTGFPTTTPIINVATGSTTQAGVLQLTNSVASNSTSTAATPDSVKVAYDLAANALPKSGGTLTGNLYSTPLQTTSTVTAANQLGVVVNLATGQFQTVVSFDAGTF